MIRVVLGPEPPPAPAPVRALRRAWAAISGGVFLLGLAFIAWDDTYDWRWVFVLVCATSLIRSVLYARWGCALQAALWGGVLAWAFTHPDTSLIVLILAILGGSAILSGILSLLPKPRRRGPAPEAPRPPGAGVVLDAEVRDASEDRNGGAGDQRLLP